MIPLITIAAIKEISLVNSNVDAKKFAIIVERVQDVAIRDVLGDDLYQHILAATTYTAAEQILVDEYILKYLTVSVEIESALHYNYDIRNKSVGRASDEYVSAGDFTDIDKLQNNLNKTANHYRNLMIDYLNNNSTDFPLWENSCYFDGKKRSSFEMSVGFGVARKKGNYYGTYYERIRRQT